MFLYGCDNLAAFVGQGQISVFYRSLNDKYPWNLVRYTSYEGLNIQRGTIKVATSQDELTKAWFLCSHTDQLEMATLRPIDESKFTAPEVSTVRNLFGIDLTPQIYREYREKAVQTLAYFLIMDRISAGEGFFDPIHPKVHSVTNRWFETIQSNPEGYRTDIHLLTQPAALSVVQRVLRANNYFGVFDEMGQPYTGKKVAAITSS